MKPKVQSKYLWVHTDKNKQLNKEVGEKRQISLQENSSFLM